MDSMEISALSELRASVGRPFEEARAMPKSVYTSPEFLERELELIFRKEWYCAGRSSALPNPGDYLTFDLAGEPIMVIRDNDGVLRAQSNVCLHRMSTLLTGQGNAKTIVCPYHAWTYGLDGALRGAPAMTANKSFCKSDLRLPSVRCEDWHGWIMVSLNPDIETAADKLSDVHELIADFQMANYVESFRETHVWNTNWKVLGENFMESYHLPVCHADTIGGLSKLDEMICPPGRPTFNYHTILKDDTLRIGLAHPENTIMKGDRRRTTFLLTVYPSLFITLTPGYFWYLSLHPKGVDHVQIIYGGGMSADFAGDDDANDVFDELKTLLDEVNEEDKGCTERVYRGLCADLSTPGPISHLERPNYDFARYFHSMVDR